MLPSHFFCRKYGNEGRRRSRFLHVTTSMRFLTFDQAHHSNHFESEFAGGLNGLDCGRSRRAHVVHDHHGGALFSETFNTATGAMLLLRLAHQETVDRATGYGDCNNYRVSTHREAANGRGLPLLLADLLQKNLSGQLRAAGVKRRGAAVDVVVAACTRRQLEIADAKRL